MKSIVAMLNMIKGEGFYGDINTDITSNSVTIIYEVIINFILKVSRGGSSFY